MSAYLNCALEELSTTSECKNRGGMRVAYWVSSDQVDWATIVADALQWDTATEILLDYTMLLSATFTKVTFERKTAFYDFTFTTDEDLYQVLITFIFEGKNAARRLSLQKALNCCSIVFHLFDNNGLERVVGIEFDGTNLSDPISRLKVGRHLDSSGTFGDSKARDEVDLVAEHLCAPMFATVTEAQIPV